jgi:hypothetical protein
VGLKHILKHNVASEKYAALNNTIAKITKAKSARDLYMAYSLLHRDFSKTDAVDYGEGEDVTTQYLKHHRANLLEMARIYLLSEVLEADAPFFRDKVANIIQVADTAELATFLRFLSLLPQQEHFKHTAVEALRTNISILFDAIALENPYPAEHFNDQQWNQMYLKAAFMQRDLSLILDIDRRANKDLARIISDYAHERWAASRTIDPMFWRPVTPFLEGVLLTDMKRLLDSDDLQERRAGALCCHHSNIPKAKELLQGHEDLIKSIVDKEVTWNTLKQ